MGIKSCSVKFMQLWNEKLHQVVDWCLIYGPNTMASLDTMCFVFRNSWCMFYYCPQKLRNRDSWKPLVKFNLWAQRTPPTPTLLNLENLLCICMDGLEVCKTLCILLRRLYVNATQYTLCAVIYILFVSFYSFFHLFLPLVILLCRACYYNFLMQYRFL